MTESEYYRRLAEAFDEVVMWRNLVALLPFTVYVNHERERAIERAARLLGRIPTQREPVDLRVTHRLTTPRGHL